METRRRKSIDKIVEKKAEEKTTLDYVWSSDSNYFHDQVVNLDQSEINLKDKNGVTALTHAVEKCWTNPAIKIIEVKKREILSENPNASQEELQKILLKQKDVAKALIICRDKGFKLIIEAIDPKDLYLLSLSPSLFSSTSTSKDKKRKQTATPEESNKKLKTEKGKNGSDHRPKSPTNG